jgi:hypothetical protein
VSYGIKARQRTPGSLAASGTVLHRFFHRCINYMREHGEDLMPVEVGLEFLNPIMSQVDVPDRDFVPLSFKDMDHIRRCATNWCQGLSKEIIPSRVVEVEYRLFATVECIGPGGEIYEQRISGQLDVLMAWARECARIGDHKTGPARLVQPKEVEYVDGKPDGSHLDAFDWAQAEIYSFLVWFNYPKIRQVEYREWSVYWGETRHRILDRDTEYERIRDRIACQASALNAAIVSGPDSERWPAMAGQRQCGLCSGVRFCKTRMAAGIPATEAEALEAFTVWHQSAERRKTAAAGLKVYVDANGPLALPGGKMLGFDPNKPGKNFGTFLPSEPAPEPTGTGYVPPPDSEEPPF